MHRTRIAALAVLVLLLLLVGANAVLWAFVAPYTDEQIKASLVDTWEVEAIAADAGLILCIVSIPLALVLANRSGGVATRRLAALSVFLAISVAAITVFNHVTLTERTAQLTGQSFGGFYGLP